MAYYKRWIEGKVKRLTEHFKVVVLTGPRQVGKTTTLLNTFVPEGWSYFTADDPEHMEMIHGDPKAFFRHYKKVILDEFHLMEGMDRIIKLFVDMGEDLQVIITGSSASGLLDVLGDSLAGRAALVSMYPPTQREWPRDSRWEPGMIPPLRIDPKKSMEFWKYYEVALTQKDIPSLLDIKNPVAFYRLFMLLANRTSNRLNISDLSADLGNVSQPTTKRWLDALSAVGAITLLPPYITANSRFRKSPKIYFFDPGFPRYLGNSEKGALFENAVFTTLQSRVFFQNNSSLYWYMDKTSREVDFIVEKDSVKIGFEAKSKESISFRDASNLAYFIREGIIDRGYIVHPGKGYGALGPGVRTIGIEEM